VTLDQLVIELSLDPKKLTKGQNEALASFKRTEESAKRIADSIEEAGRHVVDTLYKIRSQFIAFTTAALEATGVEEFFRRMVNTDVAVGNLARGLGIATEELSKWQIAVRLAGGEAADADQAITELAESVRSATVNPERYAQFVSHLRPLMSASGLNFEEEMKDVNEGKLGAITNLILKISQAGAGRNIAQMTLFFKQMGLSSGFINLLTRSPEALRAFLAEAERIGPITDKDREAALRFNEAWVNISGSLTRFFHNLVTYWGPTFARWLDYWAERAEALGNILEGVGIGAVIGSVVPGLGTLAGAVVGGATSAVIQGSKGRLSPTEGAKGGFNPDFQARLDGLKKAMPPGMSFSITSGFRTYDEQARLYANRGTNPYPVAPPGSSPHERGVAADVRFGSRESEAWIRAHASEFGLGFPVPGDPIHMEMAKRYSAMAGARTSVSAGRTSNTNVDSDVNIQNVNINAPHATNTQGIVREFGPFLNAHQRRALALSANSGAN
jgi:hypothetical protein